MPTFITLATSTDQGMREINGSPKRIRDSVDAHEQYGVKLKAAFITMGLFDAVAIWDAPEHATMTRRLLTEGVQGSFRTMTMWAFSPDHFAVIVARLD